MPLKLIVNKIDDPATKPESFVFHQERITIGRDNANDLPLDDTKRVASKQHAELVVGSASVHLTDLGSKNFTYLNGDRLEAGEPYPVRPGDTIRISDFEIGVDVIDAPAGPDEPAPLNRAHLQDGGSILNGFEGHFRSADFGGCRTFNRCTDIRLWLRVLKKSRGPEVLGPAAGAGCVFGGDQAPAGLDEPAPLKGAHLQDGGRYWTDSREFPFGQIGGCWTCNR